MDSSNVSDRRGFRDRSTASSNRNRSDRQDRVRQVTARDATRQQRQAASNREAARRQTRSAFRDSIEQDQAIQRQNAQAGVEKMVRSVVRKESSRITSRRSPKIAQQRDVTAQSQYVRKKLNSTYNHTVAESTQDENLEPSPSQRQQQRAIDDYQQSTRNRIDRIVKLVI